MVGHSPPILADRPEVDPCLRAFFRRPLRKIIIATEAEEEINAAYFWHEDKEPGLGDRFLAALKRSIHYAASQPDFHPIRFGAMRRIKASNFPYVVYFEFDDESVSIQSVFHGSRNPSDLDRLRNS